MWKMGEGLDNAGKVNNKDRNLAHALTHTFTVMGVDIK